MIQTSHSPVNDKDNQASIVINTVNINYGYQTIYRENLITVILKIKFKIKALNNFIIIIREK